MCIIIYEQWRRKLNYKKMYFNSAEKEAKTFLRVQKKFFFSLSTQLLYRNWLFSKVTYVLNLNI